MSSGFDAAAGDVGNCRNYPGLRCERGMDLSPEDFGWATTEIMKVADVCCNGKVVSVLEGGYGEYRSALGGPGVKNVARVQAPATRHGTRNGAPPALENTALVSHSVFRTSLVSYRNVSHQSALNRDVLSQAVVGHVHRLIDPYGPSRLESAAADTTEAKGVRQG